MFYLNIPIGIIALTLAWAAAPDWETPRRPGRIDLVGAALYGVALVAGLIGLTLIGSTEMAGTGVDPAVVTVVLLGDRGRRLGDRRAPRPARSTTRSSIRGCSGACRSAPPRSSRC